MTIDKQKLLQWIEATKYVQSEPYGDLEDELKCKGALKILNSLERVIELGNFAVDNGEEVKG